MYKLLEEARIEGMAITLGEGDQILVKGKWGTPTASRLAEALRRQKPLALAWLRDLTAYVGETVTADVWLILGERASKEGWEFEAYAVKGGARIVKLHARGADQEAYRAPWEEPVQLDPDKDYIIDEKTGRFVEVPGGVDWRPVLERLTAQMGGK